MSNDFPAARKSASESCCLEGRQDGARRPWEKPRSKIRRYEERERERERPETSFPVPVPSLDPPPRRLLGKTGFRRRRRRRLWRYTTRRCNSRNYVLPARRATLCIYIDVCMRASIALSPSLCEIHGSSQGVVLQRAKFSRALARPVRPPRTPAKFAQIYNLTIFPRAQS